MSIEVQILYFQFQGRQVHLKSLTEQAPAVTRFAFASAEATLATSLSVRLKTKQLINPCKPQFKLTSTVSQVALFNFAKLLVIPYSQGFHLCLDNTKIILR